MSFDRTKADVQRFSGEEKVYLDDLLNAIRDLSIDAMEINDNDDLTALGISDHDLETKKSMLESAYILGDLLLTVFKSQNESLLLIDESVRSDYDHLMNELNELISAIKSTREEIEKEKRKREELEQKKVDLETVRGPLLTIQEECKAIQNRINVLSDSALDDIEKKSNELKEELSKKEEKFKQVEMRKEGIIKDIEGLKQSIEKDETLIEQKKTILAQLKREYDEIIESKNGYEKGIENQKTAIARDQKLLDEYQDLSGKLGEEREILLKEKEARLTAIRNALSSVFSDNCLKETLYHIPGVPEVLSVENYPDYAVTNIPTINKLEDFQKSVIEPIEDRADSLIEILSKTLRSLVFASESITKEEKED